MSEMKQTARDWIDGNKDRLIEISDIIWDYAELGFVEFKSAKLLADELEKNGFKVEREVAGIPTAFVATWGSGKPCAIQVSPLNPPIQSSSNSGSTCNSTSGREAKSRVSLRHPATLAVISSFPKPVTVR